MNHQLIHQNHGWGSTTFHLSIGVLREALVGVFPIRHQGMPGGCQVRSDLVPAPGQNARQQQAEGATALAMWGSDMGDMGKI